MTGLMGPAAIAPGGARAQISAGAELGFRGVQIDGAHPETRARDLDRSARRDLAALLRRAGLALSGVDLMIPPAHLAGGPHLDRAVAAVIDGVGLVAELATLGAQSGGGSPWARVLAIELPPACPADVVARLSAAAETAGVELADHSWPARAGSGAVGPGIDPAAIIFAGADPVAEVTRLAGVPVAARLTDMSARGRVEVGSGQGTLDRYAYEAALHARGYRGWLVVDVRGLTDAGGAARRLVADGPGEA